MPYRLLLLFILCFFSQLSFAKDPFNAALFESITYLLPQLAYPDRCKQIRQSHHGKSLEAFSQAIVGEYKELYLEYMREEFFPEVSSSLRPSCSVVDDLGAKGFAKRK